MLRAIFMTRREAIGVVLALALPGLGSAAAIAATRPATQQTTTKSSKSKTAARKTVHSRQPAAQTAPTPSRISEIQTALAKAGAYHAEPNGKWDAATIDALTQFQSTNGLPATGKLTAPTLEKLGLGSETAGRAAPLSTSQTSSAPTADLSN